MMGVAVEISGASGMAEDERVEDPPHLRLLREQWEETGDTAGWMMRSTPGLPLAWPPRGRRPRLAWYGFAYGYPTPMVADGTDVAAPWGRVEQVTRGRLEDLRFTRLSEVVVPAGIQGVRPMSVDESDRLDRLADAQRAVASARTAGSVSSTHAAAYQQWRDFNGAVVHQLPEEHGPFLRWIAEHASM